MAGLGIFYESLFFLFLSLSNHNFYGLLHEPDIFMDDFVVCYFFILHYVKHCMCKAMSKMYFKLSINKKNPVNGIPFHSSFPH